MPRHPQAFARSAEQDFRALLALDRLTISGMTTRVEFGDGHLVRFESTACLAGIRPSLRHSV
jgi:hypothetical protein